ncbi:hypothetical protein [Compostibacter hankyongensis]|uniref:1,4-alpha-glucan branching enzyme n=1 Tax=Compostibacter hankyongensis TaxID=1007089 RepID=A0ABP8FW44_9BACT
MTHESNVITDHEKIRKWVEEREGRPARVKGTGGKHDAGLLRINFPGDEDGKLEDISWDEFFKKFEEEDLAFLYQDETAGGKTSYFNKLVRR